MRMRRLTFILIFFLFGASVRAMEVVQRIEVVPEDQRALVLSTIPFQEGGIFDSKLLDVSKRLLLATDRFEQADIVFSDVDKVLRVTTVPKLYFDEINWTGDAVDRQREIQKFCIQSDEPQGLSQERISQITRCIAGELNGEGYLDALVLLQSNDAVLTVDVRLNDLYHVESLEFTGMKKIVESAFLKHLVNQRGEIFQPLKLDQDTKEILRAYLKEGYYFTEVFKAYVNVDPVGKKVSLQWRIKESQKVKVSFSGDYSSDKLLQAIVERDETFPKWFLEEVIDQIETDFKSKGYLSVSIIPSRNKETLPDSSEVEYIDVLVKEGPKFLLTDPEWVGISDLRTIQKYYGSVDGVQPGIPFDETAFRKAITDDFTNLLMSKGYLDLQVRSIDFVIDQQKSRVRPVIYLNEGDSYRISEFAVEGLPDEWKSSQEFKDLKKSLKNGDVYDYAKVVNAQNELSRILMEDGFLDVQIQRTLKKSDRGRLSIIMTFNLGPRYRVAKVLLKGTVKTDYDMLRREILIQPGELYLEERVRDTVDYILRLGLARSVDVRVLEKDVQSGTVYVLVEVNEGARFRFEMGPGYGTVDGVRGVFKGTYANIAGTGRRLTVTAKANRKLEDSGLPQDDPANGIEYLHKKERPFIERRITVEYFEPSLFHFPVDGRLIYTNMKISQRKLDLFKNTFTGAVDYRFNRRLIFSTHYNLEFSNPFNVLKGANSSTADPDFKMLTALGEVITIDYLDDSFSPIKGYKTRVGIDVYDKFLGGEANFWQVTLKQDFYRPIWILQKGRVFSFVLSLNAGFSAPYRKEFGDPKTQVIPVEKRFFLGGENSVRGFKEQAINPADDSSGILVGGNSYVYYQTEFYVPLLWGVDFLTFADAGNLFRYNSDWRPFDLRYTAGPGFRWNTPVGPLKIGYGFILDRKRINGKIEPVGQFYFGVGPI